MDSKYPVILINNNVAKKGNLKELTLRNLQNETRKLFRDQFDHSDVTFETEEGVELDNDADIVTEFEDINEDDDDDEDDEDHDDDDDDDGMEPEKEATALRITVTFTPKKVVIKPPKPVQFRAEKTNSCSVILRWLLGDHQLEKTQISSLEFEIKQLEPKLSNVDDNVVLKHKCCPGTTANAPYLIKLSGLKSSTSHTFVIRSALYDTKEAQYFYSESSEPLQVTTRRNQLISPHDIPQQITPPTELQVIELNHDSAVLAWNHVTDDSVISDYEYYISESDVFGGETIAATEDSHFVKVFNLMPSTRFTFVCRAKYYDPERKLSDQYYQNEKFMSTATNAVTIETPEEKVSAADFRMRSIEKVKWVKRRNELELFWEPPTTFCGKIRYQISDKVSNTVLGDAEKLPVVISTGDNKSIFGRNSGKYIIGVLPILIDEKDPKNPVYCKEYDIQITIDDDKEDASNESELEIKVVFDSANAQRVFTINTVSCNFERFQQKLSQQFGLQNSQSLKIKLRFKSPMSDQLQQMDVDTAQQWDTFLKNHGNRLIREARTVHCFIHLKLETPSSVRVTANEKFDSFDIHFRSVKTQKYEAEVECKRDPKNTSYERLGDDHKVHGAGTPLNFRVKEQWKAWHFRFRVRCRNPDCDSDFSRWTSWHRLPQPVSQPTASSSSFAFQQQQQQHHAASPLQARSPLQGANTSSSSPYHHSKPADTYNAAAFKPAPAASPAHDHGNYGGYNPPPAQSHSYNDNNGNFGAVSGSVFDQNQPNAFNNYNEPPPSSQFDFPSNLPKEAQPAYSGGGGASGVLGNNNGNYGMDSASKFDLPSNLPPQQQAPAAYGGSSGHLQGQPNADMKPGVSTEADKSKSSLDSLKVNGNSGNDYNSFWQEF